MKKFKRIIAVMLAVVCLCSFCLTASAADYTDAANDPATMWITSSQATKMVYTRPMYDDLPMVTAKQIGTEDFKELTDIFALDGKIYVLDSEGKLVVTDENYNLIKEYKSFQNGGETVTFEGAKGVYVYKDIIYICDTGHARVILADFDGNVIKILTKPDSEMWPNDLNFSPIKLVVDKMDYLYVLCDGSFYGAVMYTPEYEFKGFFGANVVSTTVLQAMNKVWDMLFMNNTKLSKSGKKLPYSFVDLVLGADGYIFTCTGVTSTSTSAKGSVRRLNPTGNNILQNKTKDVAANSSDAYFATTDTSKIKGYPIQHNVCSISVDNNNYIYVLDAPYGRIYVYDIECNLITTIGGGVSSGNQKGTFRNAVAITTMGEKIYAVDNTKKCIISFKINDYGKLVQQAQALTINGDYTDAAPLWKEVVALDTNSIIAYRGLAKACLINDEYHEAMDYALKGYDRNAYSQAFEYVRMNFLERHFTLLFVGLIILVAVIVVLLHYKKKKKIVLIKNKKIKIALGVMFHPADTYYEIKRNNNGSVVIATMLLIVWYIFKIIGYSSGFIFNDSDIKSVNAWYALAQTFGLALLFVASNWLVCVLFEGKGTLKQIYVATCYSIMPLIIQAIGYDILANVLTLSESNFITVLNYVCYIYTAVLLIFAIINIQEFSLGKFVFTTIVTGIAMILVIFLIFLVAILLQQAGDFVKTVFFEAVYR